VNNGLRVIENMVLRKIFGGEEAELHESYIRRILPGRSNKGLGDGRVL
jgi:hypothetical protein